MTFEVPEKIDNQQFGADKAKFRLLFVLHGLDSGGAEHQTVNQINRLWEAGFFVHLAVLSTKKALLPALKIPPENIHLLDVPKMAPFTTQTAPNGLLYCAPKMWRIVRKHHFTHVVANLLTSHYVMRLVGLLEIFRGGKRFKLVNYHRSLTYDVHGFRSWGERFFIGLNNLLARFFDDQNIFISAAVAENIHKSLPVRNGHVVHNSIPVKDLDDSLALQYLKTQGLEHDYLAIVPGRVHPVKGQIFFLENTRDFWRDASVWRGRKPLLVFVGGGTDQEKLAKKIREFGLDDICHISGAVANDLMLSFMKLADLVLIPSIFEGFGNVAIEALMQGATVLASDAGGLPEIIRDGENGHLFKKENGDSLREKLTSVVVSGKRFDPEKLRHEFESRWTLEAQLTHLLKIIA